MSSSAYHCQQNHRNMASLTSSPLDHQSCDSGLNCRHSHWCNKSNTTHCAHRHSAQNSARLSRSTLQNHLEKHTIQHETPKFKHK